MNHLRSFFMVSLAGILFFSCHKSERDNDTDLTAVKDLVDVSILDNDVFRQLHLVADSLPAVNKVFMPAAGCATVTVSGTSYPKTVTLDFGTSYCAGPDGRNRSGKLIAVFTGKYRDSLTTITLTSSNFYLSDRNIDVSKTIVNKGRNASGNMVFAIYSSDTITNTNSKTVTYSAAWTCEWTGGEATPGIFSDDTYLLTGSVSGTGSRGSGFAASITSPLGFSAECGFLSSGKMELTPANLSVRYLDYGSGACDNKIELNLNGNLQEITMW